MRFPVLTIFYHALMLFSVIFLGPRIVAFPTTIFEFRGMGFANLWAKFAPCSLFNFEPFVSMRPEMCLVAALGRTKSACGVMWPITTNIETRKGSDFWAGFDWTSSP